MCAVFRQSEHMRTLLSRARGTTLFSYEPLVKVDSAGRVTLFPGSTFLHISRAFK